MPLIHIPNPGIRESMIHPTNVTVVDQVLEFLRLKEIAKDIRFITHSGDVRNPGSGIGERPNDYVSYGGTNRVFVEVEDDTFQDGFVIGRPDVIDTEPLFFDRSLGISLRPFMESHQAVIKIRFNTHSQDSARQTREAMKTRIGSLEDGIQHKVDFSLGLHEIALCLLQDVWLKRNLRAGYGDTFQEYVANHSSSSATTISDASGFHTSLAFKRRMNRINGYFIIQTLPEKPTYLEGQSIWEFSVEYRVNYDVPVSMQVTYPIMVHQQFLDRAFLPTGGRPNDIRDGQANKSLSQHAAGLLEFGQAEGNNLVQDMYFNIPEIDQFEPSITPRNTATIFIALLSLSKDETLPLLNLGDLGKIVIDQDFLQFLKEGEYQYLTDLYKSFFYIHLYENNNPQEPEVLYCDEKLDVYSRKTLDPRKTYRVRFSMVADITLLDQAALDRLWKYPNAVKKLVLSINNAVRNNTSYFHLWNSKKLEPWMLSPVWAVLSGKKLPPEIFHEEDTIYSNRPIVPTVTLQNGEKYDPGVKELPSNFYVPSDIHQTSKPNDTTRRAVQIQDLIVFKKG